MGGGSPTLFVAFAIAAHDPQGDDVQHQGDDEEHEAEREGGERPSGCRTPCRRSAA